MPNWAGSILEMEEGNACVVYYCPVIYLCSMTLNWAGSLLESAVQKSRPMYENATDTPLLRSVRATTVASSQRPALSSFIKSSTSIQVRNRATRAERT